MPILAAEPCTFPDDLFDQGSASAPEGGQWWVLHTHPRAEKAIGRRMRGRRVPFFLPMGKQSRRTSGRTHSSYLPLFPGYVFIYGDEHARLAALETNQIVRVLTVPDQQRLEADLKRVYRLLTGDLPLTPESGLQPGAKVEIVAGPFEGVHGKLVRSAGKARLLVEVEFLRQGVSVEVEAWMVREL